MFSTLFFLTTFLVLTESICINNGNYTVNSTYDTNLNTVLSSIPINIDVNGFYNASVGRDPDKANVIALCKGDAQLDECRGCIINITRDLRTSCPNQKQAVDWTDACMLRYSNETMFGIPATSPKMYWWNSRNATSPVEFMEDLRSLVDNLRRQAADGGSMRKVAAANATGPAFQFIYALVQCTPDLSADDCTSCLIDVASDIPRCCDRKKGGRIAVPSCFLRYETYRFVNDSRLQELAPVPAPQPLVPAPQPPVHAPQPPLRPETPPTPGNHTTRNIIIIVVSSVILAVLVFIILLRKRIKRKPEENYTTDGEISFVESLIYTLRTIKDATNDFSIDNKLGKGGFGVVYKGTLSDGKEIAVKRLSQNSGQGDQEFKNEVVLLAKLQHRNLVRLLGFCLEGVEKLLIYEFVQNASLDRFIFDPVKRSYLDWEKRYRIIGGIARGILYLHEDSQLRIIHRDLKPGNVLLDGAMNPKIADFGLARLFEQDETQANTSKLAGTFGYMAPEYVRHGQFSVKSDVFSFGVLILEIVSGRKINCPQRREDEQYLLSYAWKNWHETTMVNIVDPCLRSGSGSIGDMLRCIHIALLCVQENAADRPAMASIVVMLNSFSLTLARPSEPAFYMSSYYDSDTSLLQEHNSREPEYINSSRSNVPTRSDNSSINEVSITEVVPR